MVIIILVLLFLFLFAFGKNDSQFWKSWTCFPLPTCSTNDHCKNASCRYRGKDLFIYFFLPLGTEGRESTKWMHIGSQLLRGPSFSGSTPSTQSSRAVRPRMKSPHLLSHQVFLLNLGITSSLCSEMVWAASLYSYEYRREVPASLLLKHTSRLHSLNFLKGLLGESALQTVSTLFSLFLEAVLSMTTLIEHKCCLKWIGRTNFSQWQGNYVSVERAVKGVRRLTALQNPQGRLAVVLTFMSAVGLSAWLHS